MMEKIIQNILESQHSINPLDRMVLEEYHPDNVLDEAGKKRATKIASLPVDNTDYYDSSNIDYPYFTSVEIIANKAPFKDTPDRYIVRGIGELDYKEWVYDVKLASKGIITETYMQNSKTWVGIVRYMSNDYLSDNHKHPTEELRESLISLGWNPSIPFTPENRVKVNKRFMEVSRANLPFEVVDLSAPLLDESEIMTEEYNRSKLHPLYIVLVEGSTLFASAIKNYTKGIFSHVAVSLDEKLNNMYSFNMNNGVNAKGGFSIEDIKKYPQENQLNVFTIFLKDTDIDLIKSRLNYYLKNVDKTTYSIVNVLLLPLQKIAVYNDLSMICSEFVDNLLKFCDVDITKKKSPFVVPMDFYNVSKYNNKIYKLYDGEVSKYNYKQTRAKVNKLLSTVARHINELAAILEIKDTTLQFSDDGDLLIKNMNSMDYEKEYRKIHTTLKAYEKADNVDGMKYALAELWFINSLLEKEIYSNKNDVAHTKCRARVLNDFNKYMDKVLKSDPNFNFSAYYESTPFGDHTIKVKNSTMKYTIDLVKYALKPTV